MRAKLTFMVLALVALGAFLAPAAGATPSWKFEGKTLEGSETILGGAIESSMTVPGLTTKCEDFLYKLTIKNESGGKGSVTETPLYNCSTDSTACFVGTIGGEGFPWAAHLATFSSSNYIVIEGVTVNVYYEGEECVLNETLVTVTGSAGGVIDNTAETATFDSSTLSASGTALESLGQKIEWNGVFPTEAFEWHRNQALTAS